MRYIGNDSSGKMGTAVANAAAAAGAEVTLVATKMLPVLPGVEAVYVTSAAELHDAMLANFDAATWWLWPRRWLTSDRST